MPNRSLKLPVIIFVIGIVLALVAYMLTGIVKTPTITEQDFNYSATYRLNGETKTVEGIYRCQFKHTGAGIDPQERYYEGYFLEANASGEPEAHSLEKQEDLELRVVFIFSDAYLMGDGDPEDTYSDAIPEPYLAVYDKEGAEYSDSETLGKFDAELLSWETPQPIENTFVFCGFSILHGGSMLAMLLVGILVIIACVIFVKRDECVCYKVLDKISAVLNFIIGFAVLPFITLVVFLMPIYVSGEEVIYQVDLCIPAITAFTIAASLSLRRKGFRKTGFFIQFAGPALFFILGILETLV